MASKYLILLFCVLIAATASFDLANEVVKIMGKHDADIAEVEKVKFSGRRFVFLLLAVCGLDGYTNMAADYERIGSMCCHEGCTPDFIAQHSCPERLSKYN